MAGRNHIKHIFTILVLIFSLSSCTNKSDEEFHKSLDKPFRKLASYGFEPGSSIIDRVGETPEFVLSEWMNEDKRQDYSSYAPGRDEMEIIKTCLGLIPDLHKRVLNERLVGIYFINNFMGSGLCDWLVDEEGKVYCYIAFNPEVFQSDISGLITKKENTPFIPDKTNISVQINCGDKHPGFLYILLHESTHAVDYIMGITPYTSPWFSKLKKKHPKTTPFIKDIWKDYNHPLEKYDFEMRTSLKYYGLFGGPEINISDARALYSRLSKTPFASMAGSVNWAEDLAEFLTFYHLTEKLKTSYSITVLENRKPIFIYEPMKNSRLKKRFPVMSQFYE